MAFENFPTTEQPVHRVHPPQKDWRGFITGALVIALLATWGYIIWDKGRSKATIAQKEDIIANTSTQRDLLQKELEDATMRYDMIKTSSAKMEHGKDSVIYRQEQDISQKKARIQELLSKVNATQEELAQAKTLINSLNGDIEGFKTKIETLQGEKLVLKQEKDIVTNQRDQVIREYDSANEVIRAKEAIIDVGSTLHASNFSIRGINVSSGKEKETTTAKRVDKLRISFDIDENRLAQSGAKNIYVCITGPTGQAIANMESGSGNFNTRDGEEKIFTQRVDFNYTQGQRQTLSFDWSQNSSFATGNYRIEIYHNGFKIGEGTRTLKKGGWFS
jgi:hypothetical protein